jgi:acetyl esterase/lipase
VNVYKDLVFARENAKDLLLDLYVPEGNNVPPLVVWVHGGAWKLGNKNNPRDALKLLDHGFAIASINYRLSHEATFPAQIIDCKAALRWLRANQDKYNYNADKIGAFGSSAGGHLVALMGASAQVRDWDLGDNLEHSSQVQAVCNWYGPTDFLKMDDVPGRMVHLAPDSPESQLIGGDIREQPEKVKAANPITYVSAGTPPFLIMHGTADLTVIPAQSVLLKEALQKLDVPHELVLLEGAGHGGGEIWMEQMGKIADFFRKYLP